MRELFAWAAGIALYLVAVFLGLLLFLAMLMVATYTIDLDARAPAVQVTAVLAMLFFAIWSIRRMFLLIVARSLRRRSL